ncbi:MAG: 7-cyano-7-deazaguanine synthase QueC [Planctomycetia bacterium]|nr:7-cyano-7-deazaguanine synthase QueC [Planctomycetia bacterium]
MLMQRNAVVLLSGGLDSTTVCAMACHENRRVFALSFDYNQRHRVELQAAREAAKAFQVAEHLVLPIDLSLFGGSSLTDPNLPVERTVPLEEIGRHIPSSYVPARNTVFLSLALAFAETRNAEEIWIGVNRIDYSGYPDCRPEFIAAFENLANLATKAAVENGTRFSIVTPLLDLTKGEIIRRGIELGVDYSTTRTCYSPDQQGRACGVCESCLLRLAGFRDAGLTDPAPYANDPLV